MSTHYTAEDVKNILQAVSEEFLVDIKAKHVDGEYLLEFSDVALALLNEPVDNWFENIALYANGEEVR